MFRVLQLITLVIFIIDGSFVLSSTDFCSKTSSTCGKIRIDFPFWTKDYGDQRCDQYLGFRINCTKDRPVINISNNLYFVESMDSSSIKVMDVDIDAQQCPRPRRNFTLASAPFLQSASEDRKMIFFYNCTTQSKNVVQQLPCLDDYYYDNSTGRGRSFAFLEDQVPKELDLYHKCEENVVTWVSLLDSTGGTEVNYLQALRYGINLKWYAPRVCKDCFASGGQCSLNTTTNGFLCHCADKTTVENDSCQNAGVALGDRIEDHKGIPTGKKVMIGVIVGAILLIGVIVGVVLLLLLVVLPLDCRERLHNILTSCWKDNIGSRTDIDVFLEKYGSGIWLPRYRYSDLKKLTNSFRDILGAGGYGSVFKGKLRDGRLVAVKVLKESKGKGEEFINEVATIGGTNHVNVVSLLGFCIDGTKRALVYEYMPNGSLEKFIYQKEPNSTTNPLGWETLYQIALGIARGLDYLHRGCNTRILHFDIKPHNILLDHDFCPKISDFGLAKLCPTRDSPVSMHLPRGTRGYVAPEVCSLNSGGASHKSDVYSYGIMVLEMISGRNAIDKTAKNTSDALLAQWIFKHFDPHIMVEGSGEIFKEETTRKMVIVALWCIQTRPSDRPSITKVVDMLEGNSEDLQTPPNPFVDSSTSSLFTCCPGTNSRSEESGNCLSVSMEGR